MPPTRRSETAPRRSSRVTDLEKTASAAQKAAAAAADKATKEAAALARKAAQATKKDKKTVRRSVVKPAARAVAKAAGVDPDAADKPKPKRKAPTDRSEGAGEPKKQKKDVEKKDKDVQKEDKGAQSQGKVKVGEIVPDVILRDENDEEVSLKSLYDEAPLVIFSYPKADTPGCTTQACLYRDSVKEGVFSAVGYTVLGLSRDKPTAQNKWKTKHTLGYTLLSDPKGELLGQLGQTADKKRCHWVIEKGGKLLEAKHGVKPADDAKNALAFIKSLGAAAPGDDEKKEDAPAGAEENKDAEDKKDDASEDKKNDAAEDKKDDASDDKKDE
ncbi:hypothetical protein JCM3770_005546 [Rhodotorula araucariae]